MTTNSQLSTTEPKKQKQRLSKQPGPVYGLPEEPFRGRGGCVNTADKSKQSRSGGQRGERRERNELEKDLRAGINRVS